MAAKSYKQAAIRYAKDVVAGKIIAGNNVRECKRFLDDLERDDLELHTKEPDFVINIIERVMVHVKGEETANRTYFRIHLYFSKKFCYNLCVT